MHKTELQFTIADETELNELVSGKATSLSQKWPDRGPPPHIPSGMIGVVWRDPAASTTPAKPLMLVVGAPDRNRLFNRFSQVRSDLSPISAWCHICSPERFERIHEGNVESDLGGFDACWAGLVIAEAAILAARPVSSLKIASCMATQSYAIGRTFALYGSQSLSGVFEAFDSLQSSMRQADNGRKLVREALLPIWTVLSGLLGGKVSATRDEQDVMDAVRSLLRARQSEISANSVLANHLADIPESELLFSLEITSPEDRLRQFDKLVSRISDTKDSPGRFLKLSFLAGYLATVAAGGTASLKLAEAVSVVHPQITAWAYVLGSVGESVTWTSGFDGLGRLVARELGRSFNISEPPSCDFSLDEGTVLIDRQLGDPLVHLRIKQTRTVSVALFPGVNVIASIADQGYDNRKQATAASATRIPNRRDGAWEVVADAIFPHILPRIDDYIRSQNNQRSEAKTVKKGVQRKLPLD